jgi:alkaline phosphatase D
VKLEKREEGQGRYSLNRSRAATILGPDQWTWLEEQLRKPADLRLLVSSIQVVPEEHAWESWSRFPLEHKRLYRMIKATKAEGVIILSGDRHMAELSRHPDAAGYPLYDLTASGLNMGRGGYWPEPNRHRIGEQFFENHFGLITVDWLDDPLITLHIRDLTDRVVLQHEIRLSELRR